MQNDCYKVEVLYLTNPYLIWLEVRDPAIVFTDHDIKFEQVGIYGVLPVEATIRLDEGMVTYNQCKEWMPAATALIRECLADQEDVYFAPLHVDRRSSIFDDNIHKFGDIYVKRKNGKTYQLSKVLKSSGLANYDPSVFYQYLSLGYINTKLSSIETQNILREIEKYFIRKNVPKKKWEDPIKNQTSVVRVSYELEEALTTTNVDRHHKKVQSILDNKKRDLELCKGVDELSLGRGSTRQVKEKYKKSPAEKKLELMNAKKSKCLSVEHKDNKSYEHVQAFEDIKDLVDTNASPCSKKISSKTDAHKAQILKKVMSKTAEKISAKNKLFKNKCRDDNHSTGAEVSKPVNHTDDSLSNSSIKSTTVSMGTNSNSNRKQSIVKEEVSVSKNDDDGLCSDYKKNLRQEQPLTTTPQQKLAYPPQNVNSGEEYHSRVPELPCYVESNSSFEKIFNDYKLSELFNEFNLSGCDYSEALIERRKRIFEQRKEFENFTNIEISKVNLNKRGKTHNSNSTKDQVTFGPPGINLLTLNRVVPPVVEDIGANEKEARNKRNESILEKKFASSSCSLQKRLKLRKEIARNRRSCQPSTKTTKDSSNDEEKTESKNVSKNNTENDSVDSISDIFEKLGMNHKRKIVNVQEDLKKVEYVCQGTAKANPFQNYDLSRSVFMDKLTTPIMMVHSKMNRRFIPSCELRDTNFSDHIRSVLKNLRVEFPMMLQSITWNSILRGYSVFMIAHAFGGKTMGYLPAVCRLVTDFHESEPYCDSVGPFCIIVCGTSQSVTEIDRLARLLVGCNEKVISCHYGHDELLINTSLLNGCEILITTAPYLVRLLHKTNYGVDLQRLATFVFDDWERLSKVYLSEIKFCLQKVKEMLKLRVNKELQVQYIVASQTWCDFTESLAKKAPNAVVCMRAFTESVLYAKVDMKVSYVKEENKLNHLLDFLEDVDPSKRTIVLCDSDKEVDYLKKALRSPKYFLVTANSNSSVEDLYNVTMLWKESRVAPVMVCNDDCLYHLNIENANYLVHYSMPPLYSVFSRRFGTLNESFPSIFKSDKTKIKILILFGEKNVEIFPKLLTFVKRCTNDIPDFLDKMSATVLAERDLRKAQNYAPLCDSLMSLGECPELFTCKSRHTIFKDYDKPKEWMPKSGEITFQIIHYHSAAHYSARLIANIIGGTHKKYPPSYSHMSLTMGMHYAKQNNRIPLGIPKVGDICAFAVRDNLFCRCRVLKVLDANGTETPRIALVNLLDEEIIQSAPIIRLYHLPDQFKDENTYVLHVRLGNIQPNDKDVIFSELAKAMVKDAVESKRSVYMKGKIALTVGSCIFLDTLEVCQDLKSLKETVVIYNVKRELLAKHAVVNPDHLSKIVELCKRTQLELKPSENVINKTSLPKVKPNISWAYLEDDMLTVRFGSVVSPHTLFVRLTKFEDCMNRLISDIQQFAASNTGKLHDFEKGDIVLAEYPDDRLYERARIDEIDKETVKCFFVDQGEWHDVTKDKLMSISDSIITQLPFQAIECRLVGIKPSGDQWTDFSTNWLYDKCFEMEGDTVKQLYVTYFIKEPAKFAGEHKYGVIIVDTYGNEDLIINQLMIDLNLADEVKDEMKYLDLSEFKNTHDVICNDAAGDDDSWEKVSKYSTYSDRQSDQTHNILLSQPIRSVPLIETDDETDVSEKWHINMTEDMAGIFKPFAEYSKCNFETTLPAIENNGTDIIEEIDVNSLSKNIKECTEQFEHVKINADSSNELDSNDLSSPKIIQSATVASEKIAEAVNESDYQLRKPKLNWRQTKTMVTLKIQLFGVDKYDLKIQDRSLTFTATVNDTDFGFEIGLYGVIDKNTATHSNKGQYILVKFNKIMHKNWLTLTKDGIGGIQKWIVYDVDSIDTSSDEEEIKNDDLYNIVKNANNNTDSDSDDDWNYGAVDDVSFAPQKDY